MIMSVFILWWHFCLVLCHEICLLWIGCLGSSKDGKRNDLGDWSNSGHLSSLLSIPLKLNLCLVWFNAAKWTMKMIVGHTGGGGGGWGVIVFISFFHFSSLLYLVCNFCSNQKARQSTFSSRKLFLRFDTSVRFVHRELSSAALFLNYDQILLRKCWREH